MQTSAEPDSRAPKQCVAHVELKHVHQMSTNPDSIDVLNSQIQLHDRSAYEDARSKEKFLWQYSVVPGFFKQLMPETDETKFDYFQEHLGAAKLWKDIFGELERLNNESDDKTAYKLFLLARHGQGYHNLANLKYGEKAWNEHWLKICGDGEIVWAPDPELTELGLKQASDNAEALGKEFDRGLILPHRFFASPFRRSVDTLIGLWLQHVLLKEQRPLIKEDFRETMGVHVCDKRSPRSVIAEKYEPKGFVIEDGFEEEDIYFKSDYREKVWEQALRMNRLFEWVMNNTSKTESFVSITSHLGSIRTQLMVLGHRPFAIGTGGMIPVLVKATRV